MKRSINQASSATLKWRVRDMQIQVSLAYLGGIPYSVVPPMALRRSHMDSESSRRKSGTNSGDSSRVIN